MRNAKQYKQWVAVAVNEFANVPTTDHYYYSLYYIQERKRK